MTASRLYVGIAFAITACVIAVVFIARSRTDTKAAERNYCDDAAASPSDPDRMAEGVSLDKIVPRIAMLECEKAVSNYPRTPRFRYQLGRALAASDDNAGALKQYQLAADAGYRMAHMNIGFHHSSKDPELALAAFYKAKALGIKQADEEISRRVFDAQIYVNPRMMQAMFDGTFPQSDRSVIVYWNGFTELVAATPACAQYGRRAHATLSSILRRSALSLVMEGLSTARQNHRPGDLDGAAAAGFATGQSMVDRMNRETLAAREDVTKFLQRHKCPSPITAKLLGNVEKWSAAL